jgi:hypothetical protein
LLLVLYWSARSSTLGCHTGEFWAVSQAAPMRRVHINGLTTLMDYCSNPSFASGGFIADSEFDASPPTFSFEITITGNNRSQSLLTGSFRVLTTAYP